MCHKKAPYFKCYKSMWHIFCCLCIQCLQHLDVAVLGELVPRLCELLKSGVGLGTKVKKTQLFSFLCIIIPIFLTFAFFPHSGSFLSLFFFYQGVPSLPATLCLSSQGGCASVIVSLTVQCPQDLTPHSGAGQVWICSSSLCIGWWTCDRDLFLFSQVNLWAPCWMASMTEAL